MTRFEPFPHPVKPARTGGDTNEEQRGRGGPPSLLRLRKVSGGGAARVRTNVVTVALRVAIQAGAANPQDLGSAQPVAVAHLQHSLDLHLAEIVEGQRPPVLVSRQ